MYETVEMQKVGRVMTVYFIFYPLEINDTIDETLAVSVSPKNINTHHIESLKHHHRHISIAHLNTQSLASTFDAFHLMLENHKFDIVALSETWLKDNKHQ